MYKFKFADIGEGIHEGQVLKWMFKEGDSVKEGETLCLVETDKVNAEIPSPVDGKIVKIFVHAGETIHVGEVLVNIDDGKEEENTKSVNEGVEESAGVVGEIEVSSEIIETSHESVVKETNEVVKVLATPVARQLAKDLGVDLTKIKGSGVQGRIMKEDILSASNEVKKAIEAPNIVIPKLDVTGNIERVKISKLRKTIAQNMVLSKTVIPHVTSMDEFDVTELVSFRKAHKDIANDEGITLTYLPFIIKALTLSIKEHKIMNSSFDSDNDEIIYKNFYNVGIAVDTPDGLIVPVVKNTDKLGIITIAKELQTIIEQARNRTIPIEKLQNGTITITNYGATGSSFGVPIIRYPEAAILGVGLITKKPVVINDEIVIRDILPISLSYDHRIIDGGDAGRFLKTLRHYLSNPMLLLLS